MPLQTKVNIDLAYGVAGDNATPGQSVYTAVNPVADVDLPVGGFVFPVVEDGVIDNSRATNIAGDAEEVLGFVERIIAYVNYDMLSCSTMTVPQGSSLTVAVRGDYWAVSTTDAKVGDKVYASSLDGSISTGPAIASQAEDGDDKDAASAASALKGVLPVGGFGFTIIQKDDWDYIQKTYGGMEIFKNGLIFASEKKAKAQDEADEKEELRHGLEPVDVNSTQTKPTDTAPAA